MTRPLARAARIAVLILSAAVAVTALGGGSALIIGSLSPATPMTITPPPDSLAGSPFSTYLVPGFSLLLGIGGLHALAFVAALRRTAWAPLAVAVAAFALLVWIFVQMVWIPFSPLQAVYEAAGVAELALLLVQLGVLDIPHPAGTEATHRRRDRPVRTA